MGREREGKAAGQEEQEHCVALAVQPEFKLSKSRGDGNPLEWSPNDNAHPFWGIKRKERADEPDNSELTRQEFIFVARAIGMETTR